MEAGHARHWSKLRELCEPVPKEPKHRLGLRARWLAWLAMRFSGLVDMGRLRSS
jgi:hypothetical protein